jgi:DNA-binding Lrp family transcriptional regulator
LELAVTQPSVYNPEIPYESYLPEEFTLPTQTLRDPGELTFEIGLWLSGLESFLTNWDNISRDANLSDGPAEDWSREFRLTNSALLICSNLNYQLRKTLSGKTDVEQISTLDAISVEDCDEFVLVLRDVITLNSNFIKAESLRFDAWKAWNALLVEKLRNSEIVQKFTAYSNRDGIRYLPADLQKLLQAKHLAFSDQADLHEVLSRFAIIMQALSLVGAMLRNDEPLKPSVLIFAKVYERSQELISFIDNRLTRFKDEGAELFASLDSASYTASLELKKVYQQELTGLVGIRPAPSIFAKVETAYSLLNDGFEQTLAVFARLIQPDIVITELFPSVQSKLERSLKLRSDLWVLLKAVQAAEKNPEKSDLEDMKNKLGSFTDEPVRFLFFKDRETLERFSEEIVATIDNKDLVPILHRFGAYLETLFGLVNMRTVLGDHPFNETI